MGVGQNNASRVARIDDTLTGGYKIGQNKRRMLCGIVLSVSLEDTGTFVRSRVRYLVPTDTAVAVISK